MVEHDKHRYQLRLRPHPRRLIADPKYAITIERLPCIDSYRTVIFARRACRLLNDDTTLRLTVCDVWDSKLWRWVE